MSVHDAAEAAPEAALRRRKWRWIVLAGTVCLLSWLALGIGIVLDVGAGTMFALATAAAMTTEGWVWLSAAMLGVNAYQARRQHWLTVRRRPR